MRLSWARSRALLLTATLYSVCMLEASIASPPPNIDVTLHDLWAAYAKRKLRSRIDVLKAMHPAADVDRVLYSYLQDFSILDVVRPEAVVAPARATVPIYHRRSKPSFAEFEEEAHHFKSLVIDYIQCGSSLKKGWKMADSNLTRTRFLADRKYLRALVGQKQMLQVDADWQPLDFDNENSENIPAKSGAKKEFEMDSPYPVSKYRPRNPLSPWF